jgi:hypothetical protein
MEFPLVPQERNGRGSAANEGGAGPNATRAAKAKALTVLARFLARDRRFCVHAAALAQIPPGTDREGGC